MTRNTARRTATVMGVRSVGWEERLGWVMGVVGQGSWETGSKEEEEEEEEEEEQRNLLLSSTLSSNCVRVSRREQSHTQGLEDRNRKVETGIWNMKIYLA